MTGWINFLILIVLADINHAKEEKKKALIIAVDETRPEESEVIISDLTIKDRQRPTYEREDRAATDRQLDYIIVRPEDLKALKGLDDVSIEKPKIVRYPESGSDESDDGGRYSPYSEKSYLINGGYPDSPQEISKSRVVKYPSRPAPPLVTYSGSNSNADTISYNSPNPQNSYAEYKSPSSAPYRGPVPNHDTPVNDHSYGSLKPSSYSNPSSYSDPNTYPEPSSYSVPGSSYGSKSSSYSSGSPNYRQPNEDSYSGSPYRGSRDPSAYSGPSSYSETPSYGASKPSSYSGTTDYESAKPSDNYPPSSYENSKPISYSDTEDEYSNRKPSTYSSYSASPYSSSKSSSHSNSNPHYDSSEEKGPSESGKYIRSPETVDKAYSYDGHHSPKSIPNSQEYDPDTRYTPANKHFKSKYYDSPSISIEPVKHISYDDITSPYKNSGEIEYDPPKSAYNSDLLRNSPNTYNKPSKPSRGTIYRNSPPKKSYTSPTSYYKDEIHNLYGPSTKPSYGKKLHGMPFSSAGYKPRSGYNSKAHADEYYGSPAPISSHTGKSSYDSLKTSYKSPHEPSSYEEPLKPNSYRYPSHNGASKVAYDSPAPYSDDQYSRPSVSGLKENSGRSPYGESLYSKSKHAREYSSPYDTPHSKNEEFRYESRPLTPSKYDDSAYNDQEISTSKYKNLSPYKTHSNAEYGSRYPTYTKKSHSDQNSPAPSYFTAEDGRSPEDIPNYKEKKRSGSSSDSHSHHYDEDSSYVPDNHSVKTNYSPVRPAPLHDQLEQPRYPPLPRISKNKKDKRYSSEEVYSNEKDEDYKPELSYTKIKNYKPESYNPGYDQELHIPSYSSPTTESRYPSSAESNKPHYSSHSSEESGEEPQVYTKTTTTTYTKPSKDSSNEHVYSLESTDKNSYDSPVEYLRRNRYDTKGKNAVSSHAEYPGPIYKESVRQSEHPLSYSPTRERKYASNTSLPISYSSLSEILPPKRVEGVVYRSRQSYPHVKGYRKQKGFLPYKPFYTKSASTVDYKPYESVPSEIRENNVTKDLSVYEIPDRKRTKSTNYPHSKRVKYSSPKSHTHDTNEDSSLGAIPGEPGKDYPVLKEAPYNQFTCENKIPGFYADVENRCQAYYQCNEEGRLQSFLCPNGTIFNQLTFVCEWWFNVDCSKSEKHFGKNSQLYKIPKHSLAIKSKRTARNSHRHSEADRSSSQEYPLYHSEETDSQSLNKGRTRSN